MITYPAACSSPENDVLYELYYDTKLYNDATNTVVYNKVQFDSTKITVQATLPVSTIPYVLELRCYDLYNLNRATVSISILAIDSNLDPVALISDIGSFETLYYDNTVTININAETFSDLENKPLKYTLVNAAK